MTAWERQRLEQERAKEQSLPSQQKMYEMLSSIGNDRDRALCTFAYLLAGRVSEIVSLKTENLDSSYIDDERYLTVDMPNKKNRVRHRKKLPISYDKEGRFLLLLRAYLGSVPKDSYLFRFSIRSAQKMVEKCLGWNTHWIRHIRLTHLVTVYDFNAHELQLFAGWSDTRPAKHYIEMNWRNLARKF